MDTTHLEIRISELLDEGDTGLHTIARIIDEADLYTYGHSERVSHYAVVLGRFMDVDAGTLETLRVAGLLHDLGKILLPKLILGKFTELDPGESRMVAAHPRKGADLIEIHPGFEHVADAIRGHHERIDGRGYPAGLKGDEIPSDARILSVVDAYDTMVSNRPYRRALPIEKALSQIRRGAGSQFDAMFVTCFVQMIRERRDARSERLGVSTLFVELSLREHERAARFYARKQPQATPLNIADLLCFEYAEVAHEDALKIAQHVVAPETLFDDLYSDDVIQEKDDEFRVRHSARIDADVGSVVRYDGHLYCILYVSELEDGRFEYRLKR